MTVSVLKLYSINDSIINEYEVFGGIITNSNPIHSHLMHDSIKL
jgi:hypothetical protein